MLVGVGVGVHVRAHVILLSMCGWFVFVSACIDACVSYVYHASKCLPEVTQKNKSKEGEKKSPDRTHRNGIAFPGHRLKLFKPELQNSIA